MLNMSATELIKEIQSLPEQEREQIFDFVLHSKKPGWAIPKPPGFFANCHENDEIEESNWLAARGPKAIVP
jgi:hypothetical protein